MTWFVIAHPVISYHSNKNYCRNHTKLHDCGTNSVHEQRIYQTCQIIVSRGDWLGKPANIKVENNGAVGYVGSSLMVHNPLFFVHKL